MLFALRPAPFALRPLPCALCPLPFALCPAPYALFNQLWECGVLNVVYSSCKSLYICSVVKEALHDDPERSY